MLRWQGGIAEQSRSKSLKRQSPWSSTHLDPPSLTGFAFQRDRPANSSRAATPKSSRQHQSHPGAPRTPLQGGQQYLEGRYAVSISSSGSQLHAAPDLTSQYHVHALLAEAMTRLRPFALHRRSTSAVAADFSYPSTIKYESSRTRYAWLCTSGARPLSKPSEHPKVNDCRNGSIA
jgi:hypothetical protein